MCLKAAFVFGINCPVAAHSCWSFMQKAVYCLTSKFNRMPYEELELLSDLNACSIQDRNGL